MFGAPPYLLLFTQFLGVCLLVLFGLIGLCFCKFHLFANGGIP